jgi:hypothetical protein
MKAQPPGMVATARHTSRDAQCKKPTNPRASARGHRGRVRTARDTTLVSLDVTSVARGLRSRCLDTTCCRFGDIVSSTDGSSDHRRRGCRWLLMAGGDDQTDEDLVAATAEMRVDRGAWRASWRRGTLRLFWDPGERVRVWPDASLLTPVEAVDRGQLIGGELEAERLQILLHPLAVH